MIATNIHVIRENVILLLRRSGYSVIEATEQWDSVYSKQYFRALPGHKYTWHIGQYTFEFTKQKGENVDPLALIAQAHEEAQQLEASSKLRAWVIGFALATLLTALAIYIF
jgi:hypothetical protein